MRSAAVPALTRSSFFFILVATLQASAASSGQPAPQTPAAADCQWTYHPISGGTLQPEQLLYDDPDDTAIRDLSVGNPFRANATYTGRSASLASTGSIDLDGDDKTDVFRTVPRSDGNLQWQYSSGGAGDWLNLAYAGASLPTSTLQFGDFDGDGVTDVFANSYSLPTYSWLESSGGTASFVTLHTAPNFADRLALGDFDGDGVTDVFTAVQSNDSYQWGYYAGGIGSSPIPLAFAGTDPALLRFGDFDGDGKTDVFAATRQPDGSTQWLYSSGGAASYTDLITSTVPYSELQFGDFDGDGKTDVLAALPQADGGLQVVYWPGGLGSSVRLGDIAAPAPALRVGDFNGDGTSDLLALRCRMAGPLAFGPLQTLATFGYKTFLHSLIGDVNGDGRTDVILVSTCQNPNQFGSCASHHLQVGAVLGTPAHSDTLVAPQQLGADSLDFTYTRALAGDFDGNGKTDLALIDATATTLTLTVATSNGDGTFALGPPQTFGGETQWNAFNPIVGDFNGDGKADLAFTTVCNTVALAAGSCTNGDSNSVRLATAIGGGLFQLGAHQDLGSGWSSYYAFAGDFNGDGKTDLLFDSTCQKNSFTDSTCTAGDSNYVYTALSDGLGSFTLGPLQNFGSGWADYPISETLVGDVNGDGRSDLVWSSVYQSGAKTNEKLVDVGFASPDGTFQVGSVQDFGSTWAGYLTLADLNHDGKADLVWNNPPLGDTDVDTYAAATSNGNGTFNVLGQGAVYTSLGYFQVPESDGAGKVPTSLTIVSTGQDSISDALFVIHSVPEPDAPWLGGLAGLALLRRGRRADLRRTSRSPRR